MNLAPRRHTLATILGATTLLLAASSAEAATIPVTTTADVAAGQCTLRDAIAASNQNTATGACPAGAGSIDTIDLSGLSGTITLGSALPPIDGLVTVRGPGSKALAISGNDSVRVLEVDGGSAAVSGLSIVHGRCTYGCGIENNASLTLDDVTVDHNVAVLTGGANLFPEGGGIVNNGGDLSITRSTVSSNSSRATGGTNQNGPAGGGIYNQQGAVTVADSTIASNDSTAVAGPGGSTSASGGGITNGGTLTIRRSTIAGNAASASGAGSDAANGGGLANVNSMSVHVTIDRSTFSGNSAAASGGSSNTSQAGGMNVYGGSFAVRSSTLSGNSAATGANLQIVVVATAANTVIANPKGGGANCAGAFTSQGYNLTDGTGCGFTQASDRQSVPAGLDPAGLAENGGPTRTITPLAGSPLIDGGVSTASELIDQRGLARPYDGEAAANAAGGDGTDIGAVEVQAPPETAITSGPADGTLTSSPSATYGFSSEGSATFECSLDGGPFAACASPFPTGALSDGAHTFEVRATDPASGPDLTPASRSLRVDTKAPQTTISKGPGKKGAPKFTLGSSEAGASFECRLDKKAFAPCESPLKLRHVEPGRHTLAVRATDAAGNTDPTPAMAVVKSRKPKRHRGHSQHQHG